MTVIDPTRPWAVVLLSMEGSTPSTAFRDKVVQLFQPRVAGADPTLNDYWKSVSLGSISVSGSQVFGWYDSGYTFIGTPGRPTYPGVTSNFPRKGQADTFGNAKQVLLDNNPGLDLSQFGHILAIYNFACNAGNSGTGVVWGIGTTGPISWAEAGWPRCQQCSAMVRTDASGLPCSQGGGHVIGSGDPVRQLPTSAGVLASTTGFHACSRCGVLVLGSAGACPAGGPHIPSGTTYTLPTNWAGGIGDGDWHTCTSCAVTLQGDGGGLSCPATANHVHTVGSDTYVVPVIDFSYDLTFLAHEMGHAFGFIHSRNTDPISYSMSNDVFPGAYGDFFDIMSAENCDYFHQTGDLSPGLAGPALATQQLVTNGLLPATSIFDFGTSTHYANTTLAPVDTPASDAVHASTFGSFIAELRMHTAPDGSPGWDRALDLGGATAAVLVHDVAAPAPALMLSTVGRPYLLAGDRFQARAGLGNVEITVTSIDEIARRATVTITDIPDAIRWRRWLVIPYSDGQNGTPGRTLEDLRDLMTYGVERFWAGMAGGVPVMNGSCVLSGSGTVSDTWFDLGPLKGGSPTEQVEYIIPRILDQPCPVPGTAPWPYLIDWRWFTGIIFVVDAPTASSVSRLSVPSGNTSSTPAPDKVGHAAGQLEFDVITIPLESLNATALNTLIAQSLGITVNENDRYHLTGDPDPYTAGAAQAPAWIHSQWQPNGPSIRASDGESQGWLAGRVFTAPAAPDGQPAAGRVALVPYGLDLVPGVGYLQARIGGVSLEFRARVGWTPESPTSPSSSPVAMTTRVARR